MTDDLQVFKAVKPIGKCEACGRDLYPHSTPNICDYRQDCSMHGEEWMQFQSFRRMRNSLVG